MKKTARSFLMLILVLVCMISSSAFADIISAGDYIKLDSYNRYDSAGIMTYQISHTGATDSQGNFTGYYFSYDTFCIQDNVYITPGAINRVAGISEHLTSNSNGPALNSTVAYLFDKFSNGDYDSYLYGIDSNVDKINQSRFQDLLWTLQQPNLGSAYYKALSSDPWSIDASNFHGTGFYGTSVINIITANGSEVQNQLYHQVPEPASMLLFGCGLAGLGLLRKRFKA